MVVTDCKGGRLEKRFRNHLTNRGFKVYNISFRNTDKSYGYNPLQFVRRNSDGSVKEQDILTIAKTICQGNKDSHEPIWDMCCQEIIVFYIAYVLSTEPLERQNMKSVVEVHTAFSQPRGELQFVNWAKQPENSDSFAAKKLMNILSNRSADKMFSSIMGFVNVTLASFYIREVADVVAAPIEKNFDITRLGREKIVLFVETSDTDSSLDSLVNTLYNQVIHTLCNQADENEDGKLEVPVHLIFDDFISSPLPDFDRVISTIRSRDIWCTLNIQSFCQLKKIYSENGAKTILANCDHVIVSGTSDIETSEYVASRVCKTPEVVMNLDMNKVIVMSRGCKATIENRIEPFSMLDDLEE